ncbi:MAG TPA: N-acetylmuramoyl-L-alanine amidase [Rhizomicrobium sp.]|nr:N-acetylmuramoyl-L-alanine amidase [Rhizomicrobium sp.]
MKRIFLTGVTALLLVVGGAAAHAQNSRSLASAPDALSGTLARSGSAGQGAEPVIIDARIGEHPDRTRFVVETSDPVKTRVFTLANPDRVVIDIPEALWRVRAAARPSGRGAIEDYRFGLFRPGDSRFVIDLRKPVSVNQPLILPPQDGHGYRVVIDMLPSSQDVFERTSGWPPDLRSNDWSAALGLSAAKSFQAGQGGRAAAARNERRVIVVDPGHGGIDSGTRGFDGAMEKDLVLDEALRLSRVLEQRGYVVHLTRSSDVYIPLRERVDAARAYQADLFISLHADSNPDPRVSGASVYTLSEASSDAEAAALARKENQSDVIAGVDLGGESSPVASILIGLAQRDTINRSVRFADTLVSRLAETTDILPRGPHRSAGFVVLKAPDVPAVLIELGYLSNPGDCARMANDAWRDRVASAIADAVDRQFRATASRKLSVQAAK